MGSKKEFFKVLIQEFHRIDPPKCIPRERCLPGWCLEAGQDDRGTPAPPPIVTITGPRRVGKTFFLYQIMQAFGTRFAPRDRLLYVNFEDDRLLPLTDADLSDVVDAYFELYPDNLNKDVAVFFDEVQHVKSWEPFVRRLSERKGIHLFLSGSTSDLGAKPLGQTARARSLSFGLLPLDFKEYLAFKGVVLSEDPDLSALRYKIKFLLDEYLIYGGYPEVALAELSAKLRILRDYFDLVFYKDMVEKYAIRNIGLLKNLIKHLYSNIGSLVSLHAFYLSLQASRPLSRNTLLEYVSYLEQEGLISMVPALMDSGRSRQVVPCVPYGADNGLRNAVSFRLAEDEERLAKNLVFQKLKRTGKEVFYRKDRGEVDFVTRDGAKLVGINVSYGRELTHARIRSLVDLRRSAGRRETDLLMITKDIEKTGDGVNFVPLWKWLLGVS